MKSLLLYLLVYNFMIDIENISLSFFNLDDYQKLKLAMIDAYTTMPDAYWRESQIKTLTRRISDNQSQRPNCGLRPVHHC